MSRNPIIPYAIIAVLGVLAVIIISFVGANQRAAMDEEDNEVIEGETSMDPEEIFQNSCANCHGSDLTGTDSNPDLTQVGNRLSEDEIMEIIIEGQGNMPPGLATPDEAEILAEWLFEEHN